MGAQQNPRTIYADTSAPECGNFLSSLEHMTFDGSDDGVSTRQMVLNALREIGLTNPTILPDNVVRR